MRRYTSTDAMQQLVEEEIYPGAEVQSDDALNQFIAENAWTVFHPCGTCRMGTDSADSVVDSRLKVHVMVGEKASELILQDNPI